MPKDDNVLDQFSEEFSPQGEVNKEDEFAEPLNPLDEPVEGQERHDDRSDDEPKGKNRHMRRVEQALARERRANTEMAARLAARSELDRFREDTKGMTVDERLLTLYGNDENGRKAAELTQSLLEDTARRAREDALKEFTSMQEQAEQQVEQETDYIYDQLEELEEEHNVDLTSNSPSARKARSEFLDYVEHLSPKDKDGDIVEYADFGTAFDAWRERRRNSQPSNRAKQLAARGMGPSGNSSKSAQVQAGEKFLRDSGII